MSTYIVTLTIVDDNPGRARSAARQLFRNFVNGKVSGDDLRNERLYLRDMTVSEVVE